MNLILVNCSVVIVAQDYLPPISHDFLLNKKIIPDNFKLKPNSINTPVVSQLYYDNGFNIMSKEKTIILEFKPPNPKKENDEKNLELLEGVSFRFAEQLLNFNDRYKAIGINFQFIVDNLEYDSFIQKFIKENNPSLNFKGSKGEILDIVLSYKLQGKQFNVTLIKMEKTDHNQPNNTSFVPLFQINVHYPIQHNAGGVSIIKKIKTNYEESKELIEGFK